MRIAQPTAKMLVIFLAIFVTQIQASSSFFACRDSDYRQMGGDEIYTISSQKASLIEEDYTLAIGVTAEQSGSYMAAIWVLQSDICSTQFRFNIPDSLLWGLQIRYENTHSQLAGQETLVVHTLVLDSQDDKILNYARYYPDFSTNGAYGEPEVRSLFPQSRITTSQGLIEVENGLQLVTNSDTAFLVENEYLMQLGWSSTDLSQAVLKQSTNEQNLQLLISSNDSRLIRRETGQTDLQILVFTNDFLTEHQQTIARSGFTDATEAITVRLADQSISSDIFMCSHSPTSIIYFDKIGVTPTAFLDTITSYSASAAENFSCLGVRGGTELNNAEYLVKQRVLDGSLQLTEQKIGLLQVDFGTATATMKMSISPNDELFSMTIADFAYITGDNDQFFFGTTTQFHGTTIIDKAFAMNTGKYRRTTFYDSSSAYSLDFSAVSSLSALSSSMTDFPNFLINDVSSFVLDVDPFRAEYAKDGWVTTTCPQGTWSDMAWSFCALVNDNEFADCSEQIGWHIGMFDDFLDVGEGIDAQVASVKSVCYPLVITSQVTDERTMSETNDIVKYSDTVHADQIGFMTIYIRGHMTDGWDVHDSKFFFGRSQIFYTHDVVCGEDFQFEILMNFSQNFRDSQHLTLTEKSIYTITNISFDECNIDLMNQQDFVSYDEANFIVNVNGFVSSDFEEGMYIIVALFFDTNDSATDYRKLKTFTILNFKQRATEGVIDIDKPWVEYYLANYQNSTYDMTPPTEEQIQAFYSELIHARTPEADQEVPNESEIEIFTTEEQRIAEFEALERQSQLDSLASNPVGWETVLDGSGLLEILFSRPVFFPSYMLSLDSVSSALEDQHFNTTSNGGMRHLDFTETSVDPTEPTYSQYSEMLQVAIDVKIAGEMNRVLDEWGDWIDFFEEDQMKMNFLTLLQIDDEIASSVNLNEAECDQGFIRTKVAASDNISDRDQYECIAMEVEIEEVEEVEETIVYFGDLRDKFTVYLVSESNEVTDTIEDWNIIEISQLHVKLQLSSDEFTKITQDQSTSEIMVQVQFQEFDPGFQEKTLISTFITHTSVIDYESSPVMDQLADNIVLATGVVFFGSFALNFITSAGVQRLLQKLAMLQNVVYFPGLNLLFPYNVIRNFGLFKSIVAFDLYQVKQLNDIMYDVTPTEPRNNQVFIIGIKTSTFIVSSSTFLYFLYIMFLLFTAYGFASLILTTRYIPCMQKVQLKLKNFLIWKRPIELIKIGQFGFLLAALCNVMNPTTVTQSDMYSYYMACGMIVVYIVFPAGALIIFWKYSRHKEGFEHKEYKEKYALLSSGLREDSFISLTYPFMFLGRRLILIIMFITNYGEIELLTFGLLQILVIAYTGFCRPFASTGANREEMRKEIFLLSLTHFMPLFTEYVPDEEMRDRAGSVMTYFFLIAIGFNVGLLLLESLDKLRLILKYYLYNKCGQRAKEAVIKYETKKKLSKVKKVANVTGDDKTIDQSKLNEKGNQASEKEQTDALESFGNVETQDNIHLKSRNFNLRSEKTFEQNSESKLIDITNPYTLQDELECVEEKENNEESESSSSSSMSDEQENIETFKDIPIPTRNVSLEIGEMREIEEEKNDCPTAEPHLLNAQSSDDVNELVFDIQKRKLIQVQKYVLNNGHKQELSGHLQ